MNDGGPAFPFVQRRCDCCGARWVGHTHYNIENPGMSLRDYFAAQSMVALSCTVEEQLLTATTDADMDLLLTNAAALSYRIADAMLEARGK